MNRMIAIVGAALAAVVVRAEVEPKVQDVLRPLAPGAVQLNGGLDECLTVCRDNWCLGKVPERELADFFVKGRPFFATGEMWGKFVRSACMFYRYRPSPELKARIDAAVKDILSKERANGSISCTPVERQPDSAGGDLWERKYVMLALERYLEAVEDSPEVLASLKRQADCLIAQIGDGEGQRRITDLGWSFNHIESSTLLEPFMRLYNLTGERRYLDFAAYIMKSGGAMNYNLFQQARDGVLPRQMGGKYPKAYEMLSLFEGVAEYYRATGDEDARRAARSLYENVLDRELTIVGNGGGDAPYHYGVYGEAWDDTAREQTNPRMVRMMETCTGVTWMKFCSQMLRLTGDARAVDAIERYVYNGLVGAMKPDGTGFSYVNLLNGNKVTNRGWGGEFGGVRITCCNLNGPTGLAYIPYVAVMDSDEGPAVNLYNALRADTAKARISISGNYPVEDRVRITVDEVKGDGVFALKLRIPGWSERTRVNVGDREFAPQAGCFFRIHRGWKAGDAVDIAFDMRTRLVPAPEGSDPAGRDFQAVTRGPVVMARDERTDPDFDRPVRVLADERGVVAARRIDPPAKNVRLALEVPVSGGSIRMVDYASVDCWDGSRVMTWLPKPVPPLAASAQWISDGRPVLTGLEAYGDDPAPVFRAKFVVARPEGVTLAVSTLGYRDVTINGRRLGGSSLMPYWTVCDSTIHEDVYPIADLLVPGENEIRVALGNGWYNPLPFCLFGNPKFDLHVHLATGRPKFRLAVKRADGTDLRVTDGTWEVCEGSVLRNNVYLGTWYDARRAECAQWRPATVEDDPPGQIVRNRAPEIAPRDRCVAGAGRMLPRPWYKFGGPRRQIVDFGRNGSGVPTFRFGRGRRGDVIRIRYGEQLYPDGTLDTRTSVCTQLKWGQGGPGCPNPAEAVDTYVRSGEGEETFTPPFTFHAFRYAEIEGLDAPLAPGACSYEIHCSNVDAVSGFECSDPGINRLHAVCQRTFLSNLVGVQSDCPGRERLGYGGDIVATSESMALNFDMREFYLKSLRDFADEARKHDGWFTETAPYVGIADRGFGGNTGSIAWTAAVPVMMDTLIRHYGDYRALEYYDDCARYLRLVDAKCPDGIIPTDIGDHECLDRGDNSVTATVFYHEFARIVAKFAVRLERTADAAEFTALREKISRAFNAKFVRDGRVGKGVQGEQALALYYGLLPKDQIAAAEKILLDDIASRGDSLTTGIFGTRALLMYLTDHGHADVAGRIVARREFPGFLYMLDNDATTLWEAWRGHQDGVFSLDHPMFGSVEEWLFRCVLGITIWMDGCGCETVDVEPKAVAGITWARGWFKTHKGTIKVEWHLDENGKMVTNIERPWGIWTSH